MGNLLAVINLSVPSQKKAYNGRAAKVGTRMDEDVGSGSRATRVDWDALSTAVDAVESPASTDEHRERADESGERTAASADENSDENSNENSNENSDRTWKPGGPNDPFDGETDVDGVVGEGLEDPGEEEAALTPAVERVAPTPAVERVAPTPAVTRVEDDEAGIEEATPEEDFTSPADIGEVSDTIGDEPREPGPAVGQQGPPGDQEQPLAAHIEEMVKRLGIVVAIAGAVSLALFPLTGEVINFLWYSILPGSDVAAPHVYHPLEYKLTQLKVASLGGLLIALPVFVYQTYRFMRPGLYPHERRYYLASVPTSLILGLLGVTFAYFVVLPAIMSYFLYYSQEVVTIAFALGATFDLILLLMGYLAVVFQIPLFVMLAIMMGLTTRQWLEDRRLLFWGAFLGVAFLFSPDPTGMAPVLVAATMVVLFEGTLLLLRWTGR